LKRIILIFCAVLLLVAVAITLFKPWVPESSRSYGLLIAGLPATYSGWQVAEQEVASTPEMKYAVAQMLNYDEAILRDFRQGDVQVTLYVAHWKAAKFPARLVAQHTPEVCWPGFGWNQVQADYNRDVLLPDGKPALPGQFVSFEKNQQPCHVVYWHIVNGRLSGFASGPQSRSLSILDSFWQDVRAASGEQLFVRISSNKAWAQIKGEPLLNELLIRLAPALRANE
jgi:hypothetical protein